MDLVPLGVHHEAALEDFIAEFRAAGERMIPAWFCPDEWPFAQKVATVAAWARGERLQPKWVPCSTWFLEDVGGLLGVINVRHRLTDGLRLLGGHIGYSVRPAARRRGHATRMLAAALPEARALGLERVMITCAPDNIGSVQAIERNGGVLEDEYAHPDDGRRVRRYWITL